MEPTNPKDRQAQQENKPDVTLIPLKVNLLEAQVMALGAKKYGAFNWRKDRVRMTVYLAAIYRHLAAFTERNDCDPESKISHLAHIRANTGILLDAIEHGTCYDDRPFVPTEGSPTGDKPHD